MILNLIPAPEGERKATVGLWGKKKREKAKEKKRETVQYRVTDCGPRPPNGPNTM
ncbi:hypothetical protein ACJIZ3_014505 [Penstemon smallii]|uniref:Uncharacterized protein n=1 Tax=Penstemon smallii TaxID=265156 RepID=A0ABD3RJR9_9LAMI